MTDLETAAKSEIEVDLLAESTEAPATSNSEPINVLDRPTITTPSAVSLWTHPLKLADVQELLTVYEREVKALGDKPSAAFIFHEMGILWKNMLQSPRNAAVCFQNAFRLAPQWKVNIWSARNLFVDAKNWPMVVQLLDAEIAISDSNIEQIPAMFEKAVVLLHHLQKTNEAQILLEKCKEITPNDFAILYFLNEIYSSTEDFAKRHQIRIELAKSTTDRILSSYFYTSAALDCETKLNQPDLANALFCSALAQDANDPFLILAAQRIVQSKNSYPDDLVNILAEQAQRQNDAYLWYSLNRIHQRAGNPSLAISALQNYLKISPNDPLVLDELAASHEMEKAWQPLTEVLSLRLQSMPEGKEQISVLLRLGALYEEQLEDEKQAIECYKRILSISHDYPAAITALGKLYSKKEQWELLLDLLKIEAKREDDPQQKATYWYRVADVLEIKLKRFDDAILGYQECLKYQPGYLPAYKALSRIFELLQRWDALITLNEQQLDQSNTVDQTLSILLKIARIHEFHRNDPVLAAATLERVREHTSQSIPTLADLSRLYERAQMWENLLNIQESEIEQTSDPRQILWLLQSMAEIHEEKFHNRTKAIEIYEKALSISPIYLPALKSLGRLYAIENRWEELVKMHRQEADVDHFPEQAAAILYKAGEVLEQKLQRIDDAIAVYYEALTLSPNHALTLHALTRIFLSQEAWENLVDTLRILAAGQSLPQEKALSFFRIGQIWEEQLGRPDLAIECHFDALAQFPDYMPSFHALGRLLFAQKRYQDLKNLWERRLKLDDHDEVKKCILYPLAVIHYYYLSNKIRATECLELILEIEPRNKKALSMLAELRLMEHSARSELLQTLALSIDDSRTASHTLILASSSDSDLQCDCKKILQDAVKDLRVEKLYAAHLRQHRHWDGLASYLESEISGHSEDETLLYLLLRCGELYEWNLGNKQRANEIYKMAVEIAPHCLPALRASRRVLQSLNADNDFYSILLSEAEATHDSQGQVECFLEAGLHAEHKLKNLPLAGVAFQSAFDINPLEPVATERLKKFLLQSKDLSSLAKLHLQRAKKYSLNSKIHETVDELVEAAQIYYGGLQNYDEALAILKQALLLKQNHFGALGLMGDLQFTIGQYAEAQKMYLLCAEQQTNPSDLVSLYLRLAAIYQDYLSDSESAKGYLQKILDIMPCNQEALTRLGTTYLAEKEWGSAADVYRQLIDLSSEEDESIHFLCTLARIAEEGFKDLEVAATSYRRALELVPGEEMIIDKLFEIYQKQNNPIELATFLEQQAKFAFSRKEWDLATKLFNKSAEIFKNCGQLSKAAESYNQVIELNPNDNTARVHLAALLAQSSTTKLVAINEFRKILQRNPFHTEAYQALFHLYADTKQLDAMMCVGHILSFLGALRGSENESFLEAKSRVPKETFEVLAETEIDTLLQHPYAKHPFSWAIRIFGDQLQKIHPPRLSDYGAGRADKLKADHPVFRMAKGLCSVFGIKQIDIYEGSMETSIILENTEPWSMIIGKGLAHKFNIREQRYLLARSAFHIFSKTPLALRLSYEELEDLFGDLVRMVEPDFNRLGRPNEDTIRRLKKTISSKIAKQWETFVPQLIQLPSFDIKAWLQSIYYSADRAALLLCGDITTALEMRLHEGFFDAPHNQTTEQFVSEIGKRPDLAELLSFILSDEHLQLRRRLGLALMENTIE